MMADRWAARAAMRLSDREWAVQAVDMFPRSWQARLLDRWRRDHRQDYRAGNLSLITRVRQLADSARCGIRPDASDADICQQADLTARDFQQRLERVEARARIEGATAAAVLRLQTFFARALLKARGLMDLWPDHKSKKRPGALKRMACAKWWRRTYRKLHARTVEACAIDLGLVRRTAGLYASDDAVRRRAGQNARNAATLESVIAVNDHGQDFTLAELAAKGTANKSIRRVELLTRIAGFEMIAKDCGHVGFMVTVSCPSRFHKTTTRADGRVVDNPKFDGSTPNEAQRYLSGQWAKCRAAAGRANVDWYGFRIAEPQQDGCPHWHCLLFVPQDRAEDLVAAGGRGQGAAGLLSMVRRYFLHNESPNEPGAKKHRVDFERIDWTKGSAVGYVIKYISKNIDGHGVGLDLFGNDAITSSQRVEAWASTWRIRQFQQIGGAPVGVWRELRRVHPDHLQRQGAPDALSEALVAVNVAKTEPGVAAIAWKRYTLLQGGTACRWKALPVRLLKEQTGECGRYGEAMPAKALGVTAAGVEFFKNHIHAMRPDHPPFKRPSTWDVQSERAEWSIGQGFTRETAIATAARVFQRSGEAASTRIHVNNCTPDPATVSSFAPRRRLLEKFRRFVRRDPSPGRPPGIVEKENPHHGTPT